jgi:rSAM/selenodomain-associated transferase 2
VSRISIIIPAFCEAPCIAESVRNAARVGDEVLVVDGGSSDSTAALARAAGARVLLSPKGRGAQLRLGAAAATGDVLLFLHADARLGPEARAALIRALSEPEVVGGNFRVAFAARGLPARVFEVGYDLQRRLLGHYYGDSAIFARRSAYEAVGGFADYPLFEDYHFVRRMERLGRTAYVREVCVEASARRFQQHPWRALARWGLLLLAYSVGVSPERLSAFYHDLREPGQRASQGSEN